MSKPRESRYVTVAKIAYRLTRQVLPKYSHPKRPHRFEWPQLAAWVLLMFSLKLSYRDREEWLLATDQVCQARGLVRVPDHPTLQRTYKKRRHLDFEQMQNRLLAAENIEEEVIASDSTGFSPGQASLYSQARSGRTYEHWLKGAYAVGTSSQYLLAWQSGFGSSNDVAYLKPLKWGCARDGTHAHKRRTWLMLADAGFDGQDLDPLDILPPIRRGGKLYRSRTQGQIGSGRRSPTGWVRRATLENRNGELRHQTQVRCHHSLTEYSMAIA